MSNPIESTARTALVTGASRGLGRALTVELLERGWDVWAVVRSDGETHDGVKAVIGDVTLPATHDAVSEIFASRPLDLLVNNAGSYAGSHRIAATNAEVMIEMFTVHAVAPLAMTKAVLPALRRGQEPRVVNVSSRLGSLVAAADGRFQHLEQSIEYRVGKAAMNMVTLACAEDLDDEGVEICSVHPGSLRTPMGADDAEIRPSQAATWLVEWLESDDAFDRRFYDLASRSELPW